MAADAELLATALRVLSAADAAKKVRGAGGRRFAEVFRHGSLHVHIYAPRARDTQRPHDRDEVYVVMRGQGLFVNGGTKHVFGAGDVLFAAAGEEHHFERFSRDFVTWVLFYGPEGGEKP
jgi:mannose-6-phosphate isomerase-like protein (cupin superfamily)